MTTLKQFVEEHGLSLAMAAKAVLELRGHGGLHDWARARGLNTTAVSALLNGSAQSPYEKERNVIADSFGVTRAWLDAQIARAQEDRSPEPANS